MTWSSTLKTTASGTLVGWLTTDEIFIASFKSLAVTSGPATLNVSYVSIEGHGDLNDFNQFFWKHPLAVIRANARARCPSVRRSVSGMGVSSRRPWRR